MRLDALTSELSAAQASLSRSNALLSQVSLALGWSITSPSSSAFHLCTSASSCVSPSLALSPSRPFALSPPQAQSVHAAQHDALLANVVALLNTKKARIVELEQQRLVLGAPARAQEAEGVAAAAHRPRRYGESSPLSHQRHDPDALPPPVTAVHRPAPLGASASCSADAAAEPLPPPAAATSACTAASLSLFPTTVAVPAGIGAARKRKDILPSHTGTHPEPHAPAAKKPAIVPSVTTTAQSHIIG